MVPLRKHYSITVRWSSKRILALAMVVMVAGLGLRRNRMPNKEADLGMLVPERDVLQSQDKRNGSLHSVLNFGSEHKGTACSKRKPRQSSKKSESVPKGDVETTSGLNIVREGDLTDAEEPSVQQVDEKKQKNDRATIEIHDIEETGDEVERKTSWKLLSLDLCL